MRWLDSVLQKLLSDIDISKKFIRVQNWSYNTIWNATKLNKRSQYFLICRAFAPLETCDHHNHPKNWDVPFCIISRKLQTLAFKEEQKAFSFQSRENAKLAEKVLWLQIKSDFMLPSCTNISKENCLYAFNWPYFLGILSSMLTANLPAGFIGKQEIIGGNAKLCALTFIPNNNVSLIWGGTTL